MQKQYDYIILGAGLSGLMVLLRMLDDPYFKKKQILLIDQNLKKDNDRTWSFWQQQPTFIDHLITKTWSTIKVAGQEWRDDIKIDPYRYASIEGSDFYTYAFAKAEAATNTVLLEASVLQLQENTAQVTVATDKGSYQASRVLNSIFNPSILKNQKKYTVLKQHFLGWFVETPEACFNPDVATFMDFSIPQRGNCRFMYVLPTSPTTALFEYTLFSEEVLLEAEYEAAIADYLNTNDISQYTIVRKEKGNIPMTCYPFEQHNTPRILYIGTAGGWTRPSTGYTFQYTAKKSATLISFLKTATDFRLFSKRNRSWYFDLLLLDVLQRRNDLGGQLFTKLFQRNPVDRLFRFLDGEATLWEEFLLVLTPPPKEFVKSLFNKVLGR